jgi:hypothetical protein
MKTSCLVSFVVCAPVLLALSACNKTDKAVDLTAERFLVEKTIHSCIGWAKTKDVNLLYSVIVNDSTYLEVDPGDKVVRGFEDFKQFETVWMNPDFKAVRYEISDLTVQFSKSGDVAWFFCMLDDMNEWKGKPANWENTRWTGVLEKRDNKWTMVQMHFSFASDK